MASAVSRLTRLDRTFVDRVALVTGAASGMGRATAHLLADEGARVVVVDIGADRVSAVVDEIRSAWGEDRAVGQAFDVTDRAAREQIGRAHV